MTVCLPVATIRTAGESAWGGRYAIISVCPGSGMGMATLIENWVR